MLRSLLANVPYGTSARLLDAGCGDSGVAPFLRGEHIVGVDLKPLRTPSANLTVRCADIRELPFRDQTFPVVSCIDVLEHMSPTDRKLAIAELVRVTERHLVIACPHGKRAREFDSQFLRACQGTGDLPPSWVVEHQTYPYPDVSSIQNTLLACTAATGRAAKTSLLYSEPMAIAQIVRRAAIRSRLSYYAANFFFGAVYPMIPAPDAETSYRIILVAEIHPANHHRSHASLT
ncbi:MAG: hypothetical protein A2V70_04535 [Planctomycetes bacterium RBG_13_63_9]|nr:MAG: hypothetical protein A2V70_04535 [Planctomycetes bacterium RBG_13_63_9]